MTVTASLFTKQLHTGFDTAEQTYVLFSDPDPDGAPAGNLWLKLAEILPAPHVLVRAKQGVDGQETTFRARISEHRSLLLPYELTKEEAAAFGSVNRMGDNVPIIALRPDGGGSDAGRFWLLRFTTVNGVPNTPRILDQRTSSSLFESEVRPSKKWGQQRAVRIKEREWAEFQTRFLEVDIADLPPELGGPDATKGRQGITLGSC